MGSRILSRSFHVERWEGEQNEDETEQQGEENPDVSMESQKSIDADQSREEDPNQVPHDAEEQEDREGDGNSDSDDEDQENVEDVAMVPMADMLNARYGGENVSKQTYSQNDN